MCAQIILLVKCSLLLEQQSHLKCCVFSKPETIECNCVPVCLMTQNSVYALQTLRAQAGIGTQCTAAFIV